MPAGPIDWNLHPILAIVYGAGESADPVVAALAAAFTRSGVQLAGLVQLGGGAGQNRCDMEVMVLPHGERRMLSEDRGPGARGCRLDHGLLLEALALAGRELPEAGLLILNRFGKIEAEGGGGRDLIAAALDRAIPVLVAVPWRNIGAFRAFVGDLARDVPLADVAAFLQDVGAEPVYPGAMRPAAAFAHSSPQ
jgi:hypothetical protein